MNKVLIYFVLFSSLTLSFCAGRRQASSSESYKITGALKGVKDGTWIYLKNQDKFNNTLLLDSVRVREGRFEFRGQLKDKVLMTMIGLKGPIYKNDGVTVKKYELNDADILWLENSEIIFEGEKGKLFQAKVTGSVTQQDFERMNSVRAWGDEKIMEFIRQNPNSFYSAFCLNVGKEDWGKEITAELYNDLAEGSKATLYGRQIANYLGLNKQ